MSLEATGVDVAGSQGALGQYALRFRVSGVLAFLASAGDPPAMPGWQ